jgi:hypothetical protein
MSEVPGFSSALFLLLLVLVDACWIGYSESHIYNRRKALDFGLGGTCHVTCVHICTCMYILLM